MLSFYIKHIKLQVLQENEDFTHVSCIEIVSAICSCEVIVVDCSLHSLHLIHYAIVTKVF